MKSKKNESEVMRKRCVELAKKIARVSVGEICEHCGKRKIDGWQMHGSHIHPEGVYKSMSADVDNILCLCASCHTGGFWKGSKKPSWHEDPIYFSDWFKKKYPERYRELEKRKRQSIQCDLYYWTTKLTELKKIWNNLN